MRPFDATTLLRVVNGTLPDGADLPEGDFTLCTDTRSLLSGQVFVALKGERFDGNDYLEAALALPGTGVIGSLERVKALPKSLVVGRLVMGVLDPLEALHAAALHVRLAFAGPVVGLTGSAGKSTTKELIRAVLEVRAKGLATEGNLNNLIGVPLMTLKLEPAHAWAVLEMGMNAPGEISRLSRTTCPTHRLITQVGLAHTEGVGGIDGVAAAKGELFASAQPGDVLLVNIDDMRVAALPHPGSVRRLTYGRHPDAWMCLESVSMRADGTVDVALQCEGERIVAHVPLVGMHNAHNALAAAAVGRSLGMSLSQIAEGLSRSRRMPMRMEPVVLPNGVLVLHDAYNANPSSMQAALETLAALRTVRAGGRLVAVLGDMLELGPLEIEAHRSIGVEVVRLNLDRLIVCGARAQHMVEGALEAGMPATRAGVVADTEAIAQALFSFLREGDVVLLKGSRGARMERVLQALWKLLPEKVQQA